MFLGIFNAAQRDTAVVMYFCAGALAVLLLLLLYLRAVRRASPRFIAVASSALSAVIAFGDLNSAAGLGQRSWPAIILVIDVLLVMQSNESVADESLTIWIVGAMTAYLAVAQVDQCLRFGLYDLPGLVPYEKREGYCKCAKPPCPRLDSSCATSFVFNIGIFLLDFYFTRGFAQQARREKEKIAAAVTATEQVAERLASLDLDAAAAVLQGSEDVPPGLCESLHTILYHLKGYKPFLPQAVVLPVALAIGELSDESSEEILRRPQSVSDDSSSSRSPTSRVSGASKGVRESGFRLVVKRVSLLRLHPLLPVVSDPTFLPSHSQVLEAVLKQAVSCKGVVDHFCGDVVSLSYNTTVPCARHPSMAVQTAAALCLDTSHGLCELRGAVVTGKAHVGVLGVPELRRHCIVGALATVCRNIAEGAGILGHRLLCSHGAAVDVACVQPTRVLLDHFVFDTVGLEDSYGGVAGVVREVLSRCGGGGEGHNDGNEWMYELSFTDEWDAYNRAGSVFVCEGDVGAALGILQSAGASEDILALFNRVAAAARVLDFRTGVERAVGLASASGRRARKSGPDVL